MISARLDHVAVAVADWRRAASAWGDRLGGGLVSCHRRHGYQSAQYRYRGGGKVELIGADPSGASADSSVGRFLRRFGEGVHHVTLTVDDLPRTISVLRRAGYAARAHDHGPYWDSCFLDPRQTGGIAVQLSSIAVDDDTFAELHDQTPVAARPDGAAFLGLQLGDSEPEVASQTWTTLGASATTTGAGLQLRWPDSPVELRIEPPPAPRRLLFSFGCQVAELQAISSPDLPSHPSGTSR